MRLRPRTLDRYVLSELLGPLALGLLVFTFLLLIDALFDLAEILIHRDVPAMLVGRLLLLNLPHIVVLTIPMALLFAILIGIGRLSADSELVALRASGVSLFQVYRPVLALSLLCTAVNLGLTLYVLPRGNAALQQLEYEAFTSNPARQVRPRVFYEELDGKILYVLGQDAASDRWRGVFLADAIPSRRHTVTFARSGRVDLDPSGERVLLHLEGSTDHEIDLDQPDRYQLREHQTLDVALADQLLASRQRRQRDKAVRELDLTELRQWLGDPGRSDFDRRQALIEIHKKFAIPVACLVFGLFGVPLGFNNHRGGRSSGFAISIAIILAYYVVLNNGENRAAQGQMHPVLAMWLPNLGFMVLGTFLLARRNRDKSLLLTRVDLFLREHVWGRLRLMKRLRSYRQRRRREHRELMRAGKTVAVPLANGNGNGRGAATVPGVVFRLAQPRLRFPNTLDRYVLALFGRVLLLVVAGGTMIYIVANFTDLVDEVLRNQIPSSVVIDYYKYMSLQIVHTIAPFVVLLTTLISFGLLSRANEVIAARALGVSLYRLAVPVMAASLMFAGADAVLASAILPHSNERVAELRDRIRGLDRVRTYRSADQQWLFGEGGYLYNYQYFDARRAALQRLHVFRVDAETLALTGVLYAEEAQFQDDGRWWVSGGWARSFDGGRVTSYRPLSGPQAVDLPERPAFFDSEIKQPDMMGYRDLKAYVTRLEQGGQEVPELRLRLLEKVAMPAVVLVMAVVGLPFAFRLGRRGALYGIGIALAIGMVFYAVIAVFRTLGEAGILPAEVAAWGPSVLFATGSLYLFLGVRT